MNQIFCAVDYASSLLCHVGLFPLPVMWLCRVSSLLPCLHRFWASNSSCQSMSAVLNLVGHDLFDKPLTSNMFTIRFITVARLQLRSSTKIILWLGVTTAWGPAIMCHSVRKVEHHCSREWQGVCPAPSHSTWQSASLLKCQPIAN